MLWSTCQTLEGHNPLWRPYVKCGKVQILCSLQGSGGQWWGGNYFLKDSSGYPEWPWEGRHCEATCEHGDADPSRWSSHCALCCAHRPHQICHEVLHPTHFSSSHIFRFNRESWMDALLFREQKKADFFFAFLVKVHQAGYPYLLIICLYRMKTVCLILFHNAVLQSIVYIWYTYIYIIYIHAYIYTFAYSKSFIDIKAALKFDI